jgi:hypothetical protein
MQGDMVCTAGHWHTHAGQAADDTSGSREAAAQQEESSKL